MEKLTYTHDAAAAAVIASVYPDAPPMAYVHSFGCQQNVNDGEKIRGVLQDVGFGLTDTLEQADLILFNTCAVREHAEQRVFGNVGALKLCKSAGFRVEGVARDWLRTLDGKYVDAYLMAHCREAK